MLKNIMLITLIIVSVFGTFNTFAQDTYLDYSFDADNAYNSASDYFAEAEKLMAKRKNADAARLLDKAVEQDAGNMKYLLKRAEAKNNLRNNTGAIEDVKKVLEKENQNIPALKLLAKITFEELMYEESDETWEKIIAIDGSHEKYIERADYYVKRKLHDKAIEDMEKAKSLAQAIHDEMPFDADTESFRKNVLDKIDAKTEDIKQKRINAIQ